MLLLVLACGALWMFATVPLRWDQQAILGASLLALATIASKLSRSRTMTVLLCILSAFCTARYAYWRIAETYNFLSVNSAEARMIDLVFVFVLLGAEIYAFLILFLGFFQTARPLNRPPATLPDDTDVWPSVDLFIPTYNESLRVVRTTALAALNIDWPADKLNVYILDDGKRSEFREFAELVGVGYIVRPDNRHAKAGNINHALRQTNSEFVAIFDCDHVPTRSFLQLTMGWFLKDRRLGMLQTPHHFYSPDPFERNLGTFRQVPNEGALFYGVIQDGSDLWNGTFFCGSCAVLQRSALEGIGGIAVETVTEDAHTSLRLQRRGWNTAYIRFPQAAGLATGSLAAHIGQRIRWARGMIQILRSDNPLFGRGLKLPQRLCYLNSMLHFLYAAPRLIFLTSPLVYLLLGCSNIYGYGRAILAYALPHLFFSILSNSRVQGRYRYSFWNEVYETVLAPYILLPTSIALISPKHGKFNVTSKGDVVNEDYFDWKLAAPYIVLLTLNLAGVTVGVLRMVNGANNLETLAINVLWSLLNVVILGAATAVARETKQRRASVRIPARIPVILTHDSGRQIQATTTDISRGGFNAQLASPLDARVGEKINAAFTCGDEEYIFPLILVGRGNAAARLSFENLSLADEERLVRVIFGRADSWMNWRTVRADDRPVLSFLYILGIALQGIAAIPVALVHHVRKVSPASGPAAEPAFRSSSIRSILLFFFGLLSTLAATKHISAQTSHRPVFEEAYDLKALGRKEPILLKGTEARTNLYFGVPVTSVVTQASLIVNYRAAVALAPRVSTLDVHLNDSVVASIPIVQSAEPESLMSAEVSIPADLLISDNALILEFKGRCAPGCNGGSVQDAWLRIEPTTHIRLSGTRLELRNSLGLLPAPFFDSTSHRVVTANITFLGPRDTHTLEASGVIASWLGTLADYRGIRFAVSLDIIPAGNVIVFVRNDSPIHSALSISAVPGPHASLRDNPSDRYGKVLVISGETGEQLLTAARAIATGSYPKSSDSASLADFRMSPALPPYDSPRWLDAAGRNTLGTELNAEDLKVYGSGSVNLYFRLAPDLYFRSRSYIPFRFRYRLNKWSPGTLAHVNFKLNGVHINSRRLPEAAGTNPQTELIGLPVQQLQSANTLTVEFAIDSKRSEAAQTYPEESVLRDSMIDLSRLDHFTEMPRLDLFVNAGYPFTKYADLSHTAVVLPVNPAPQQISLFLSMLGFFGARTGFPALRTTVLYPDQLRMRLEKDVLVLNPSAHASQLTELWGPVRMKDGRIELLNSRRPFDRLPWTRESAQRREATAIINADTAPEGYVSQFESPLKSGSSVVAIDTVDLTNEEAFEQLFVKGVGVSKVYGSLSILQGGLPHSFNIGQANYSTGHLRGDERTRIWINRHYFAIPPILFLISFLIAGCVNAYLEAKASARLEWEPGPTAV